MRFATISYARTLPEGCVSADVILEASDTWMLKLTKTVAVLIVLQEAKFAACNNSDRGWNRLAKVQKEKSVMLRQMSPQGPLLFFDLRLVTR